MTRSTTRGHDAGPVRRKSTLYCPECDHANAIDGDWTRRVRGETVEYACPACGTAITRRPRSSEADHRKTPTTAWGRAVRHSIGVWRATVDASVLGVRAMTNLTERAR
ncbi:phage terminase large subunit family protein [Halosolutus halophilus]|uniref:phage terminase large subunit family protein n=1 Tax=Halosolutus halophilus TaxID=1552990 RepID=UPI002234F8F1|nr:phage terminase large subunit family protein [Halosolutus halophilus]